MNKTQLIDAVASKAGLTKTDARKALDAFVEVTSEVLKEGDKISLVGYGTFSVIDRPARSGRNPKTGEPIQIKAKKVIKFKPGSELADAVN